MVGDRDLSVTAHRAIEAALSALPGVAFEWLHTASLQASAIAQNHDAVWCVPASPYANEDAALAAIEVARTRGIPFLGTCGGFQHAIVEFARNVLGWRDAAHAETAGDEGRRLVIRRLSCSLVEVEQPVLLNAASRLRQIHNGAETVNAGYRCNYGLDPSITGALATAGLRAAATDTLGEPRAVELDGHPFFIATLWQPERAALAGQPVPLAAALAQAAIEYRTGRAENNV